MVAKAEQIGKQIRTKTVTLTLVVTVLKGLGSFQEGKGFQRQTLIGSTSREKVTVGQTGANQFVIGKLHSHVGSEPDTYQVKNQTMEQIKDIIPTAVEELVQPTKNDSDNTKGSARCIELLEKAFEPFKTLDDPQLVKMKEAAANFAFKMLTSQKPHWLALLGTSGAGKTMLSKIIRDVFKTYLDGTIISETKTEIKRASGGFIRWRTLVQWAREGDYRAFEDVSQDYFVVVDDIGSEYPTDFTRSKMYELFDASECKWRVWTGNLTMSQIESQFDPRIASRMLRHGSVVVDVDLPDWNIRSPQQQNSVTQCQHE